jgi:hypothetical protein
MPSTFPEQTNEIDNKHGIVIKHIVRGAAVRRFCWHKLAPLHAGNVSVSLRVEEVKIQKT